MSHSSAQFTPCLEFHLSLPDESIPFLVEGYLLLKNQPETAGIKLLATSGCKGHQFNHSWVLKGRGMLPPSSAIAPLKYTVSTQRLWLPQVKGVEGSFYAIAPFQVRTGGVTRGDFGVHFDANVPGSAGCCVIRSQSHWDTFRASMEGFRKQGYQQIPLTVIYKSETVVAA